MSNDTGPVDRFQDAVEDEAMRLAADAGSNAFSRWLPDDPARQVELDHYRGLAIAMSASGA